MVGAAQPHHLSGEGRVMHEDFNLDHVVNAQRAVYGRAMDELRAGRKTSHWMWFMFPPMQGLGRSDMERRREEGTTV